MDNGWVRLGQRIAADRSRRWRTRREFAAAVGLSKRTIDKLEKGTATRYQPTTLAAVEAALGWSPGTCQRVVQGGKVRREVDEHLNRLLSAWPHLSRDSRSMLASLAEEALRQR